MESGLFSVCLIGVKDTETEELSVSSVTLPDDLQCVMSVKGEMALWKITEEFRLAATVKITAHLRPFDHNDTYVLTPNHYWPSGARRLTPRS